MNKMSFKSMMAPNRELAATIAAAPRRAALLAS